MKDCARLTARFWLFGLLAALLVSPAAAFSKGKPPKAPAPKDDSKIIEMSIWANLRWQSDEFLVYVTETVWAIEADEATWERIDQIRAERALPRYAGIRIRYALLFTWNCPGFVAPICPYWNNTIYGEQDGQPPDEALLHHGEAGCRTHTCSASEVKEFCWDAGDPIDMLHGSTTFYACPANRPEGSHLFVNPKSTWAQEAVLRRTTILMEKYGITAERIDEAGRGTVAVPGRIDFSPGKVKEFSRYETVEENMRDFLDKQGRLFALQRGITAIGPDGRELTWQFTCPTIHKFWNPDAMILNSSGGCVSSEGFPHGAGLIPNWEGLTVGEARELYGTRLMNSEPDDAVLNNFIIGIRYESNERNITGAAMSTMLARTYNHPDLVWLMYCNGMYGKAGVAWQTALADGGDMGACNVDLFRHPENGLLPAWFPQ